MTKKVVFSITYPNGSTVLREVVDVHIPYYIQEKLDRMELDEEYKKNMIERYIDGRFMEWKSEKLVSRWVFLDIEKGKVE